MNLEEYLDKVLSLKKYPTLKRQIMNYLNRKYYLIDNNGNNSKIARFFNGDTKCSIYWCDKNFIIYETGINLNEESPLYGYSLLRYTEIDDGYMISEVKYSHKGAGYRSILGFDGQKIGAVFYSDNDLEKIDYQDFDTPVSDYSFITNIITSLENKTIPLIDKRNQELKEKIVKQP